MLLHVIRRMLYVVVAVFSTVVVSVIDIAIVIVTCIVVAGAVANGVCI